MFDLLYRAYSQRLRPLAARLRKELKYPSEDIIWTVLHDIIAEQRYARRAHGSTRLHPTSKNSATINPNPATSAAA